LIDGDRGVERWSETYDRPFIDAIAIQTDIANKVAEALSIRLGGTDREHVFEGGTDDPDAHDLLLKAQAHVQQNETRQGWEHAISLVDAALARDPNYAEAIANKAWMLKILAEVHAFTAEEAQRTYRQAEAAARRAIELAPKSGLAHGVLGDILYEQLRPRAALVEYQKLMSLPGGDANGLRGYAVFLSEQKRISEAIGLIDRAIAVDPLNPLTYAWKAYILAAGRRYPEAIETLQTVRRLAPNSTRYQVRLGLYLLMSGRIPEAAEAMDVPGSDSVVQHVPYYVALAVRMGKRAEAEQLVTKLHGSSFANYQLAEALAQLGRKDEAIAALESAWHVRDSGLTLLLIDPLLDPLRGDPRFDAIVKRMDFPT
jgi:serine/threonine-protein kinase